LGDSSCYYSYLCDLSLVGTGTYDPRFRNVPETYMAANSAFQALFLLLPPIEKWVKRIEEYVKVKEMEEQGEGG
jgi:hypothetical protein